MELLGKRFDMKITIFATPKNFEGIFKIIQTNAINSWLNITPKPEIILIGNSKGVKEICKKHKLKHIKNVKTQKNGKPYISSLFEIGKRESKNNIICYINSDIILPKDFVKKIKPVEKKFKKFLIIQRRIDQNINKNLENEFEKIFKKNGKLQLEWYIDCFCFNKNLFNKIPDFTVGNVGWDNWIFYKAIKNGANIIDTTNDIKIIHQNHPVRGFKSRAEMQRDDGDARNIKLAGGRDYFFGITDAQFLLKNGKIIKNKSLIHYFRLFEKSYVLNPKLKPLKIIIRPISFMIKQIYELKNFELTKYKLKVIYWKIKNLISF
jgi:hypothetical protein